MSDFTYNPELSQMRTQGLNNSYLNNNIDAGAFRKPDYFVYIYNVSNREFERRLPPMIPKLTLKACPTDKDYVLVSTLEHPYPQADRDTNNGDVLWRYHDAKRVAQDIVCSGAVGMDDAFPEATSAGVDFRAKGLFWSLNNPPTEVEVEKANKRVADYFRSRLERATALEYTNPKELIERLSEDDHLAADYYGEEYSWHKARVRKTPVVAKVPCPVCGDDIKSGVAFHRDSEGDYCILDWKRAYDAGRVTKKQVPEDKRWEGFTL